jgi:small-conductance mechanosensitive channel
MRDLLGFMQDLLFENVLGRWVLALAAFLLAFTMLPIAKRYCQRSLQRSNFETAQLLLCVVASTHRWFIWIFAVWLGLRFLELPARAASLGGGAMLIATWVQIAGWAHAVLEYVLARERRRRPSDTVFTSSLPMVRFVATGLIWMLAVLLALDNLGVDITTLVAGLGIGGVAIALAVQTVLKDLLGSLSIALDKPFVVGDTIIIDKLCGTVERIGLKTTRLRSNEGDEVAIANADILKSRIRNFGDMDERQAVLNIHIAYGTPRAQLLRVNEIVIAAIQAQPETRFERCHLKQIAPHAVTFEAVFFSLSAQSNALHKALQEVNLAIVTELQRERIGMAYPTQRVFASLNPEARQTLERVLSAQR